MDNPRPTSAEWAMIAGGAIALLGSFPDSVSGTNAWGTYSFPILTLVPVYCAVIASLVALTVFAGTTLPARVLGFTFGRIYVVGGGFAALMAVCWWAASSRVGLGMYLMVGGSIAVVAGAVVAERRG